MEIADCRHEVAQLKLVLTTVAQQKAGLGFRVL